MNPTASSTIVHIFVELNKNGKRKIEFDTCG